MNTRHIFDQLLKEIKNVFGYRHTFIGVYVNKRGKFKIMKDAQTGKFAWYSSCAILYSEFVNKLLAKDPEFQNCDFYAISGTEYIHHRLIIHGYEDSGVKVTPELLLVIKAMPLEFHNKANVGLFMPISVHLNTLNAKVDKDPGAFLNVVLKAKQLILEETESCTSCGMPCHVPDMSKDEKLSGEHLKAIHSVVKDDKIFCFGCGIKFMANAAKVKVTEFKDAAKVQYVQQLISKCELLDITQPNFDFDAATNILKDLMSHTAKTKMTALLGDKVTSEKLVAKDIKTSNSDATQPPPWMN